MKVYGLGEKFPGIFLTRREAECMVLFLKGKSSEEVAKALNISLHTVGFYVRCMQAKLDCKTSLELIEKVAASDLLKNIDF